MGLKAKVVTGVAWMMFARLAVRSLGLISTLVLVRLLAPADFGLVAIATAVAAGLELLTLFSFDTALVQTREIDRRHYDSAWTLNTMLGAGLAGMIALGGHPIAAFYDEPRLVFVMHALALKYLLDSLGNPRTVDFRRELDFRPDFLLQLAPKIGGVLTTIPLALWLQDYRALLGGLLASSMMGLVAGYLLRPYHPRWCLSEAGGLVRFSRWLLLNNFVSFVRTRSADFIVGRMLGIGPLGLYSVANELANLPSSEMVAPISRVLFPAYVSLGQEPERLRQAFRSSLGMLTWIIVPVCFGMSALAEPLVRILLGPQWTTATTPLALLAIAGGVAVLQATTGSVYNALSKPRMIALTGALHAATLIPMIVLGASIHQLDGVAWAVLGHSLFIGLIATYWLFVRATPVTVSDLWSACWRPAAASLVMYFALTTSMRMLGVNVSGAASAVVSLVAGSAAGLLIYLAAAFALWRICGRPDGSEQVLISALSERWPRIALRWRT